MKNFLRIKMRILVLLALLLTNFSCSESKTPISPGTGTNNNTDTYFQTGLGKGDIWNGFQSTSTIIFNGDEQGIAGDIKFRFAQLFNVANFVATDRTYKVENSPASNLTPEKITHEEGNLVIDILSNLKSTKKTDLEFKNSKTASGVLYSSIKITVNISNRSAPTAVLVLQTTGRKLTMKFK